jgi:hypothetical protein
VYVANHMKIICLPAALATQVKSFVLTSDKGVRVGIYASECGRRNGRPVAMRAPAKLKGSWDHGRSWQGSVTPIF